MDKVKILKQELLLIWSTRLFTKAFTNHNKVLANTIGNVLKEVFFRALVDQVGPAYFNGFNPSAMENNVPGSSQQPNGGQFQ
jgi:hypothetical protein